MRVTPLFLAALVFSLAAFSCAPDTYRVRVNASADPDGHSPTVFTVVPGQDDIDPSGHDFYRHSNALAQALEGRGFTRARSRDESDVDVSLRFGIVGEETPHQGAKLDHLFMLEIRAADAIGKGQDRTARELWVATATAHGHLDNRHNVFKVLLAACAPYLGGDAAVTVRVHRNPVTGAFEFHPQ
ncbi:MAG: hypothetical protein ACOZEN_07365 [Thermodesulfobacteriota bacterium]